MPPYITAKFWRDLMSLTHVKFAPGKYVLVQIDYACSGD